MVVVGRCFHFLKLEYIVISLEDNHGSVEDKPCPGWEEQKISRPSGDFYIGCQSW